MSLKRLKELLDAAQRELQRIEQAAPQQPADAPRITSYRKLVSATTDRLLLGDRFHTNYLSQLHRDHVEGFVDDVLAPGGPTINDAADALRSTSRVAISNRSCYRLAQAVRSIAGELRLKSFIPDNIHARYATPRIGRAGRSHRRPKRKK